MREKEGSVSVGIYNAARISVPFWIIIIILFIYCCR